MPPGGARGSGKGRAPKRSERFRLWLALLPRHWLAVAVIVVVLLIGIPLAVALVGDLGALLLLVGVGGFALGRATARHDIRARQRAARRHAAGRKGIGCSGF
ncbi:hypothetical protein ACFQU7_10065 [Pseudoroseomonas wenyumeiae]